MKLEEYLDDADIKVFAERLGVHVDTVYKWQRGDRLPRLAMVQRITEITGGQVTASDFFTGAATIPLESKVT